MNYTKQMGGVLMPDGRRIYLSEWAFVTRAQVETPRSQWKRGGWTPLIGEADKVLNEYRRFRRRTRRQSRWYRRNQAAIQRRRQTDPACGIGKNADWSRLYPHGKHRILAWREVW